MNVCNEYFAHSFDFLMITGRMNLPKPGLLPYSSLPCPYVFVADDAFPMTESIMKPYGGRDISLKKRIFNYRLSRARRTVENAFGILASRFRIFRKPIIGKEKNIDYIIMGET